ncbi:MAG: hypothetical protein ACT4OO_01970 [Nitrospiraceae bacterium]
MTGPKATVTAVVLGALVLSAISGCTAPPTEQRKPRSTLFIGVDASGSFRNSGYYDNALAFLAHYIYGHLNELGGLDKPQAMFVASVGGKIMSEPKTFHPIHDFDGKAIPQIEAELRKWFPPTDSVTDFNPFFREVARITKERNLVLAPVNVVIITDGVPDATAGGIRAGSRELYEKIDLKPLEYLSRNVTLRLAYVNPKVGEQWRTYVPRQRVRLWTVDAEVMKGWRDKMQSGADLHEQDRFWKWLRDNVDFRVRSTKV